MALKTDFITKVPDIAVDVSFKDAYCKIETIGGSKQELCFTVSVTTEGVRRGDFGYRFAPSVADGSENFIKQAYEHLKTLPEFAGAVDC